MLPRILLMLAAAAAAVALAAGCGGNDPKEDYITEADHICALVVFQIASESQNRFGQTAPPAKQVTTFARDVVVPTATDGLNKLRALQPPEGDEQKTAAVWDALERGIDTLKADPSLYTEPNTGGAFDQANSLAQSYGFKRCGSTSGQGSSTTSG
jgi:hypothetical protein